MALTTFLHSTFESAESLIIHFLAFVAFLETATRIARLEVPHAKARAAAVVLFLAFVLLKSVALNEPEKRPNPTNSTVTTTTDEPSGVNHVVAAGIVLRRLQPLPEVAQRKGAPSRIRQVSIPAGGVDIGLLPLLTRPRLPRVRQREIQVDFSDFAQRRIPLERIPELHQDVFGVRAGHSFTPQQHGSGFAPGNATSPPSPRDVELRIQDPI